MTDVITLKLPYPPSTNTYWRHPSTGRLAGRHLISKKGREYRNTVGWLVRLHHAGRDPLSARLDVRIDLQPPDKRKRDLDNTLKALWDACTHGGLWEDDSQIDRLTVARLLPCQGGSVTMHVVEIDG